MDQKIFNISFRRYETTRLFRNVAYQIPSGTTQSDTVPDGQKERVLLRESKNCKMKDITVFCIDSFSDTHRNFRSVLQWEQTGYEAGSCVCILLK
jgi:hypothetical protein